MAYQEITPEAHRAASLVQRVGAGLPPEADIWTMRQAWPGFVHWLSLAYALGREDERAGADG